MATPSILAFEAEGRAIDFDVWVDDMQLFLQCDRADGLSLFDLTSGASPAPAADADASVRSQWATRDAAARLAMRRHLPTSERAHFSQYKSAQTLYDAVVARYSSPATAALSRLMLPYLFPDLAAFSTVADLITHLRTSDTRYRAALLAEDHFLSVCPTTLTVDLLEKALLAAEKSIDVVGASRGDPRIPVFEGVPPPPFCPLLPLLLQPTSLVSSRSALRLPRAGDAAPAKARGARVLEGRAGVAEVAVEEVEGVGVVVGVVAGVEVSVAAVEAEAAAAVALGAEVAEVAAVEEAAAEEVELVGVALRRGSPLVGVSTSSSSSSSALVTSPPLSSSVSGTLHASGVGVLVRAPTSYAPATVRGAGVAIFDLDFDAILAAMYAVTISDEGDSYRCFPPDPGIETAALGTGEAAALGASEAAALSASASASSGAGESALSGTESASASLTFTLDSGASRSFFRDRTTLTLLGRPVAVSLADPSQGPVLAHFSTVLPCPAASTGTLSGLYLPVLYELAGCPSLLPVSSDRGPAADASHGRVGPARVRGQGHERYFLLVVDDYSRYTTVFPLRSKGDVTEVLIDWIRAARLQLRKSFGSDFPVLRLHSDRGGEFSSGLLRAYCRARGIRQTFTLSDSPQQNRIAERHIGMVMDVAHQPSPQGLHSGDLPSLVGTEKVGDASAFRVWGSRAFVRDLSAHKLSPRAAPCVFLGFPPDAPGWQFYHPTSRRVLSSQDVTFDELVSYYRLFPYRTPSLPPPPLSLCQVPPR
ncbi:unnamed protein product [Closterium sp. NIES-64]|nr:unnamed protein product [Closterium sp. NIES-64]